MGDGQEVRGPRRHRRQVVTARSAALVCDASSRSRRGPPHRPGVARSRLDLDHPGVHQGQPGPTVRRLSRRAPASARPMNHTHLIRRLIGSLSGREPSSDDVAWVESQLLTPELELWRRLPVADRRHSIDVARRFESMGEWTREEMAGALLHDVGKLESDLGTWARVAATVVGPRTKRFRLYYDHESIGADMLTAAGSAPATIYLLLGIGRAVPALREADDV